MPKLRHFLYFAINFQRLELLWADGRIEAVAGPKRTQETRSLQWHERGGGFQADAPRSFNEQSRHYHSECNFQTQSQSVLHAACVAVRMEYQLKSYSLVQ